jgi:cell wall-associated NlpC family hydrolase
MQLDFAERARALVGTPFRPQGREPHALDCVGLVIRTFELPADIVRRDYRLRGDHHDEMMRELAGPFRNIRKGEQRTGDLLLMAVRGDQMHLGIRTQQGFVHAHAGIGRVVETPGAPEWPVLTVYRRRSR